LQNLYVKKTSSGNRKEKKLPELRPGWKTGLGNAKIGSKTWKGTITPLHLLSATEEGKKGNRRTLRDIQANRQCAPEKGKSGLVLKKSRRGNG